jgi:hypothetical protein
MLKYVVAAMVLFLAWVWVIWLVFMHQQHWLAVHTGVLNAGPDKYYNWWSGFGSDIGEFALPITLFGFFLAFYKVHLDCQSAGCHWPHVLITRRGHKLCKKCATKPHDELEAGLPVFHDDHL